MGQKKMVRIEVYLPAESAAIPGKRVRATLQPVTISMTGVGWISRTFAADCPFAATDAQARAWRALLQEAEDSATRRLVVEFWEGQESFQGIAWCPTLCLRTGYC